jgi:hypothetical protein
VPNNNWSECEHEWEVDPTDWDNDLAEQVICKKCKCPGERDYATGKVFWPTT